MSVAAVRQEAGIIDAACVEIEQVLSVTELDADDWRLALGVVEGVNQRVYQLKKAMLNEALRRNREHHTEEGF